MAVTPTGLWSAPLMLMENMLADSVTFGTGVLGRTYDPTDENDSATVREAVHYYSNESFEGRIGLVRPFAIIANRPETRRHGQGNFFQMLSLGQMVVVIQMDSPAGLGVKDSYITFTNFVGGIISDIDRMSGTEGGEKLPLTSVQLGSDAERCSPEDRQSGTYDFWEAAIAVEYGP